MPCTTAILAVQGAFAEHEQMLDRLDASWIELRQASDLERPFDRLVLPGGEPLRRRIEEGMPTLGTCAGMILLAKTLAAHDDKGTPCLATMDVEVERNAYGRQLGSFHASAELKGVGEVPMTFIRAPRIVSVGSGAKALATVDGRIVAARQGNQLALAFHPELDEDTRVHELFLSL